MSVDHVARIRSALANTSPPRLAAGDALVSLDALVVGMEFTERRYEEMKARWNEVHAAAYAPSRIRAQRDALRAENQRLREALTEIAASDRIEYAAALREHAKQALAAVVEE